MVFIIQGAFVHGSDRATLVGLDYETDLALLKIDATGLSHLELANSDEVEQGHLAFAFGSPLGLENSVTMGIISFKGRETAILDNWGFEDFIQTLLWYSCKDLTVNFFLSRASMAFTVACAPAMVVTKGMS